MFRLREDDDVDIDDDFLHDVFNVSKFKNTLGSTASTSCSPCVLNKITTPAALLAHSNESSPSFGERKTLCSSSNALPQSNKKADDHLSANLEEIFQETEDIDWDSCFEEENDVRNACGDTGKQNVNKSHGSELPGDRRFESCTSLKTSTDPNNSPARNGLPSPPLCSSMRRKRKFPGPAGLLPTQTEKSSFHFPDSKSIFTNGDTPTKQHKVNKDLLLSQLTQAPFESDPWLSMLHDLDIHGQNADILTKFNIAWVLLNAANKQLPCGKVPVLIVLIKSILEKGSEASVVFKDETGEMFGTIHRKVFEEYEDSLLPGAVLVVQKVSVFSPTPRKHYLNVTPLNVVCLYSPNCKVISAPGITKPSVQIRRFALEPLSSPGNSPTICVNKTRLLETTVSTVKPQTVCSKQTTSTTKLQPVCSNTSRASPVVSSVNGRDNSCFEKDISDILEDDLNNLFEDLENDPLF